MFRGILGESSGAYKTMYAMQQGFAITQAGLNLWTSVSDAYAKEPGTVWQKWLQVRRPSSTKVHFWR